MLRSIFLAAIATLVACTIQTAPPATAPPPTVVAPGPTAPTPGPTAPTPRPTTPAPAGAPDGAACSVAGDCSSGICEGLGCGAGGGRCAAAGRACTKDLRGYCGCDGVTFFGSGSCPGRRYAAAGECATAAPAPAADGAACLRATDCASGVCEGQGCGDDAPGVCAPAQRGCTRDLRPYCGCDGQTFRTSGSCPGRRYARAGAC